MKGLLILALSLSMAAAWTMRPPLPGLPADRQGRVILDDDAARPPLPAGLNRRPHASHGVKSFLL